MVCYYGDMIMCDIVYHKHFHFNTSLPVMILLQLQPAACHLLVHIPIMIILL